MYYWAGCLAESDSHVSRAHEICLHLYWDVATERTSGHFSLIQLELHVASGLQQGVYVSNRVRVRIMVRVRVSGMF